MNKNKKQITIIFFGFLAFFLTQCHIARAEQNTTLITASLVKEFVNMERVKIGIEPLKENELLDIVAQKKLENMMEENYFSHTSPVGVDPWEWFLKSGYSFAYAGENLATEFDDVYKQHQAWMNSEKHKKNILDERFTYTGVAVGQKNVEGKINTVTVQVFARPSSVSIASSNFTPETFEVPDALFYKGIKDIDMNAQEEMNHVTQLVQAGTVVYTGADNTFYTGKNFRIFSWALIGILIILIFWLEYRIFVRK